MSEKLEQIKFHAGINSDHADHFTFQLRFRSIWPTTYEVSLKSLACSEHSDSIIKQTIDTGFAFCSTR